ncbi:MAG: hydrogenase maturation nickel metallochaperone HypA [Phycisphaerae bacterium]|nr:hydrogenase maturation nickel metallochaperone HypA [Phycisphaerae bacterium]
MHELSIAKEILRIIDNMQAQHDFKTVAGVTILAGALSSVDPHSLQFAFSIASEGTCAEKAVMHLQIEPMQYICRDCDNIMTMARPPQNCEKCQSLRIGIKANSEIEIVSLEFDDDKN